MHTNDRAVQRPIAFGLLEACLWAALLACLVLAAERSPVRQEIGIGDGPWRLPLGLAFWIAVTLFTSNMDVWISSGANVALGLATTMAASALGGPLAGGLVSLIGETHLREVRGRVPWYGVLANHVGLALPAILGAFLMSGLREMSADAATSLVIWVLATGLIIAANDVIVGVGVFLAMGVDNSRTYVRTWLPRLGLASLGWLMAQVVAHAGWWSILVFAVPLFSVLQALRTTSLEKMNAQLANAARTDPLTGLGNRLRLNEDLALLSARLARHGGTAGLIIVDLDRFKTLNDASGHLAGDAALRQVAQAIRAATRADEHVYRFGGEEFLVVIDACGNAELRLVAERVVAAVRAAQVIHPANAPWGMVTASAGTALVGAGQPADMDEALRSADAALYVAKEAGRNRVRSSVVPSTLQA